jgi:hypothetical protein
MKQSAVGRKRSELTTDQSPIIMNELEKRNGNVTGRVVQRAPVPRPTDRVVRFP